MLVELAQSLSRPDRASGEEPFAAFVLVGYRGGRPEYIVVEYYFRDASITPNGHSSFGRDRTFVVTAGNDLAPELTPETVFVGDPVRIMRHILRRQRELHPWTGGPDQIVVLDRNGPRWISAPPPLNLDQWPGPESPRPAHLDISKAFGFSGAEFEVDATQGFRIKSVDFSKATHFSEEFEIDPATKNLKMKVVYADLLRGSKLQIGGGGDKVSVAKFFTTDAVPALYAWIGDDRVTAGNPDGSGYVGFWTKRALIGGTSPATAPFFVDANGYVVARGIYVNDAGVPQGIIGNNSWFKTLGVGGTSYATAKVKADASGNVTINGATLALAIGGETVAIDSNNPQNAAAVAVSSTQGTTRQRSYRFEAWNAGYENSRYAELQPAALGLQWDTQAVTLAATGYPGLRINGNQVVKERQAAVGDAGTSYATASFGDVNTALAGLAVKINTILDRIGTAGHGLTAD